VSGREIVLHDGRVQVDELEEDVVEFDHGEDEAQGEVRALAMARYFSGKKFNARGLFEETKVAWGLFSLKSVQVLGDNRFLIEFDTEEAKRRVIKGRPWRHKGDALIVVSYDDLAPPSSIVINTIAMWARLYDLPPALRKDDYVQKLGTRLGKVQMIDLSFPNYVRFRVMYSLANALVPEMKIHIRGKGDMMVPVRHENVSFSVLFAAGWVTLTRNALTVRWGMELLILEWISVLHHPSG
jgi:hypothetical protein